jgi:undecaprenol kinase
MLKRFKFAFEGLFYLLKMDKNIRLHLFFFAILLFFAFFFNISTLEWVAVLICSGVVFALEIINSVLEELCNFVQAEYHPKIKRIKDGAASAVLVFSIFSLVIACLIFLPKIIDQFY